jgi:hypothetical protein
VLPASDQSETEALLRFLQVLPEVARTKHEFYPTDLNTDNPSNRHKDFIIPEHEEQMCCRNGAV